MTDVRAVYHAIIKVADVGIYAPLNDMPMRAAFAKKDYETTTEYEARVRVLLGSLPLPANGNVVAIAPVRGLGTYDADSGTLRVTDRDLWQAFDDITSNMNGFDRYSAIFSVRGDARGRSYVGETAFGVRRVVSRSTKTFWGIAFAPVVDFAPQPVTVLSISLAPSVAKTERPNFELVVAGPIGPPYEVDEQGGQVASLDAPRDVFVFSHAVVLASPCVALRSRTSGVIYATFKLPVHNKPLY